MRETISHRYNLVPLLRFHPGGVGGSWSYSSRNGKGNSFEGICDRESIDFWNDFGLFSKIMGKSL